MRLNFQLLKYQQKFASCWCPRHEWFSHNALYPLKESIKFPYNKIVFFYSITFLGVLRFLSFVFAYFLFYFSFFVCILRYGDKTPHGTVAKLFAVFWIMLGITIFNMYTAAITSVLTTQLANRANSDTYLYMKNVGKYFVVKNYLPKFHDLIVKHNLRGWTHTPKWM